MFRPPSRTFRWEVGLQFMPIKMRTHCMLRKSGSAPTQLKASARSVYGYGYGYGGRASAPVPAFATGGTPVLHRHSEKSYDLQGNVGFCRTSAQQHGRLRHHLWHDQWPDPRPAAPSGTG